MPSRRFAISYGKPGSPPKIPLGAFGLIARDLAEAIRLQEGILDEVEVNLVALREGSTQAILEVPTAGAEDGLVAIFHDVSAAREKEFSSLRPSAAARAYSGLLGIRAIAGDSGIRFREEISEPFPEWEDLTQEAMAALKARGEEAEEGLGQDVGVTVVGEMFEINSKRSSLQIDAHFGRPFSFVAKGEDFTVVDALRWQRVVAKGIVVGPASLRAELISIGPSGPSAEIGVFPDKLEGERVLFSAGLSKYTEDGPFSRSGWDTYNARPITQKIVGRARRFLRRAITRVHLAGQEVDSPFISPTPRGGIQVEWEKPGRYLEFEFATDNKLHMLYEVKDHALEEAVTEERAFEILHRYIGSTG